jgi:hypothetical protein
LYPSQVGVLAASVVLCWWCSIDLPGDNDIRGGGGGVVICSNLGALNPIMTVQDVNLICCSPKILAMSGFILVLVFRQQIGWSVYAIGLGCSTDWVALKVLFY